MIPLDELEKRIRKTDRDIKRFCKDSDFEIVGVDRVVSEEAAAKVLAYASADALRKAIKDRTIDLPYRMLGNGRKYRTIDLASHIERTYNGGG